MANRKEKNSVRSFFSSVRVAIVLIIVIAVASILGTFIPQQEAAQDFMKRLPAGVAAVMEKLQLFDLYYSSWFLLLLGLLSVNLIVCSISRLPASIRRFRSLSQDDAVANFDDLPLGRTVLIDGELNSEVQRIEKLFRSAFRKFRKMETKEGVLFAGERGSYSVFAVYLVHLSILVILAGAIVRAFAGFDGYASIPEGGATDTIFVKGSGEARKLDFTIRCDRFTIDFYENGMPKLFRSDITLLRDDRIVKQGALLVNHPIEYEGLHIYQASYDILPGGEAILQIESGGGTAERKVQVGDKFMLAGIENTYATGLQVNHDPGAPIVATGAVIMIFGIIAVFYTSHRRIYVRVDRLRGGTRISIAGRSNRDPQGLEKEIDRFQERLQKEKTNR